MLDLFKRFLIKKCGPGHFPCSYEDCTQTLGEGLSFCPLIFQTKGGVACFAVWTQLPFPLLLALSSLLFLEPQQLPVLLPRLSVSTQVCISAHFLAVSLMSSDPSTGPWHPSSHRLPFFASLQPDAGVSKPGPSWDFGTHISSLLPLFSSVFRSVQALLSLDPCF